MTTNPFQLIEAENYQPGSDKVTIVQNSTASNSSYIVGTKSQEVLKYGVNIPTAGTYSVVARVASAQTTFTGIGVSAGNQQKSSPFSSTGGSTNWQNVSIGYINLSSGQQNLSIDLYGSPFSFDSFQLSLVNPSTSTTTPSTSTTTPSTSTPSSTTPNSATATQSYHLDTTSGKNSYVVNILKSGTYSIYANETAADKNFKAIFVSAEGQQRSTPFYDTGTSATKLSIGNFHLDAGQQTITISSQGNFKLNSLDIVSADAPTAGVSSQVSSSGQQKYSLGNVIYSKLGNNTYTSGNGTDTISYTHSGSAINANLATGKVYHFLASSSSPLKIMAVGDSITAGLTPTPDRPGVEIGAYRDKLRNLLAGNGFNVNFVGPSSNGPDDLDKNHAGYPGYTIDQIGAQLSNNSVLSTYQPQKVLLLAGTNDILHGDPSQAPAHLTNLIDQITNVLPDTQVLVGSIPPIDGSKTDETFPQAAIQYNSLIPGIVNSEVGKGKNVSYVDIFDSLSTSDLVDGVHPGDAGNTKIAQDWYNSLLESNSGTDTLSNFKNIIGSKFNDSITAGSGNSIIDGGGGDDLLTGGSGRDTFVLAAGRQGTATITNFTEGKDLLGLSSGLQFNQLSITQGTDNHLPSTSINYNGQQLALLKGVQASTISSNDFIYA